MSTVYALKKRGTFSTRLSEWTLFFLIWEDEISRDEEELLLYMDVVRF